MMMTEDRTLRPSDDQEAVRRFVQNEVHLCLSHLVHALAGALPSGAPGELPELCDQAAELSTPLLEYEGAAREAGWIAEIEYNGEDDGVRHPLRGDWAEHWQGACEQDDTEPHEREVFEHWAVSPWLADKLEAKGEKVDRDFAGLTVWARTCTGQAILLDSVICEIFDELHKDTEGA